MFQLKHIKNIFPFRQNCKSIICLNQWKILEKNDTKLLSENYYYISHKSVG